MADSVPPVPPSDDAARVPDPHRGEPLPTPDAGVRPEAVASGVRPEQDEPGGPLPGLVTAAAAEVEEEVTGDPSAEALLAQMGVEDEGIETGQIMGTVAAILISVVVLIVALIWFIYEPFRADVAARSEAEVRYAEYESNRAAGLAQISDYRTTGDGLYGLPIERAMGLVAAGNDGPEGAEQMPTTRAGFNTAWIEVGTPRAVQAPTERGALTAPAPVLSTPDGGVVPNEPEVPGADARPAGTTDEAVGIDDPDDVE